MANTTKSDVTTILNTEADHVVTALKDKMDKAAAGHGEVKAELNHIIQAAKYLQKNWKKAVPAIAAMGASAYLMTLRSKSATKKTGGKMTVAKAKTKAKTTAKKLVKKAATKTSTTSKKRR